MSGLSRACIGFRLNRVSCRERGALALSRLVILALLVVAIALTAPGPNGAARAATAIRAAAHDGYGRIVFDWEQPVRYNVEVAAGNLIVSFNQPLGANADRVPAALNDYVTAARISSDRRTVTMPLKGAFRPRSFTIGTSVVVDLMGGPARAEERSAPQRSAAAQVPSLPRLPVRTG